MLVNSSPGLEGVDLKKMTNVALTESLFPAETDQLISHSTIGAESMGSDSIDR